MYDTITEDRLLIAAWDGSHKSWSTLCRNKTTPNPHTIEYLKLLAKDSGFEPTQLQSTIMIYTLGIVPTGTPICNVTEVIKHNTKLPPELTVDPPTINGGPHVPNWEDTSLVAWVEYIYNNLNHDSYRYLFNPKIDDYQTGSYRLYHLFDKFDKNIQDTLIQYYNWLDFSKQLTPYLNENTIRELHYDKVHYMVPINIKPHINTIVFHPNIPTELPTHEVAEWWNGPWHSNVLDLDFKKTMATTIVNFDEVFEHMSEEARNTFVMFLSPHGHNTMLCSPECRDICEILMGNEPFMERITCVGIYSHIAKSILSHL